MFFMQNVNSEAWDRTLVLYEESIEIESRYILFPFRNSVIFTEDTFYSSFPIYIGTNQIYSRTFMSEQL